MCTKARPMKWNWLLWLLWKGCLWARNGMCSFYSGQKQRPWSASAHPPPWVRWQGSSLKLVHWSWLPSADKKKTNEFWPRSRGPVKLSRIEIVANHVLKGQGDIKHSNEELCRSAMAVRVLILEFAQVNKHNNFLEEDIVWFSMAILIETENPPVARPWVGVTIDARVNDSKAWKMYMRNIQGTYCQYAGAGETKNRKYANTPRMVQMVCIGWSIVITILMIQCDMMSWIRKEIRTACWSKPVNHIYKES